MSWCCTPALCLRPPHSWLTSGLTCAGACEAAFCCCTKPQREVLPEHPASARWSRAHVFLTAGGHPGWAARQGAAPVAARSRVQGEAAPAAPLQAIWMSMCSVKHSRSWNDQCLLTAVQAHMTPAHCAGGHAGRAARQGAAPAAARSRVQGEAAPAAGGVPHVCHDGPGRACAAHLPP